MKVIISKFRNIGDTLLTGPMASALVASDRATRVSVMVMPGWESMLEGHPDIVQVLVTPMREAGESGWGYFRRSLAYIRWFRRQKYSVAINSTEGDRGLIGGWLSGARRRIGYLKEHDKWWRRRLVNEAHPWRRQARHTVLQNLDLVRDMVVPGPISVKLTWPEKSQAVVDEFLERNGWRGKAPLVHVHPVSRWFFKCWVDQRMAKVIDALQRDLGACVVVSCGPGEIEREYLDRVLAQCETAPIDAGAALDLKQLAALSARADLFFGVDSAPMHMAAAVDTPVVALFGPSSVAEWGPWPNGWEPMHNPYPLDSGNQSVGPHRVIQKTWSCVPCRRDGCDGSKRSRCLDELAVAEVMPHLREVLAGISMHGRSGKAAPQRMQQGRVSR